MGENWWRVFLYWILGWVFGGEEIGIGDLVGENWWRVFLYWILGWVFGGKEIGIGDLVGENWWRVFLYWILGWVFGGEEIGIGDLVGENWWRVFLYWILGWVFGGKEIGIGDLARGWELMPSLGSYTESWGGYLAVLWATTSLYHWTPGGTDHVISVQHFSNTSRTRSSRKAYFLIKPLQKALMFVRGRWVENVGINWICVKYNIEEMFHKICSRCCRVFPCE